MKIFWLTLGQIAAAILLGLVVAMFLMFFFAHQPVVVPEQTLSPIPTPAPVAGDSGTAISVPANYGIMVIGQNSGDAQKTTVVKNYGIVTYNGNCLGGFTGTVTNAAGGIDQYTNWCGGKP